MSNHNAPTIEVERYGARVMNMETVKGLAGVIAGETAISNVEGDAGRLTYRGYDIGGLVELPYEAVMWLLIFGDLPAEAERQLLCAFLDDEARLGAADRRTLMSIEPDRHPMLMLQAMMALLDLGSPSFPGLTDEGARGLAVVAKIPTLIASFHRFRNGQPLPEVTTGIGYLENFLMMLNGQAPAADVDILRVAQILQMEHSFNASTFTARVVASTLAPVESVLSAAAGALYGKLHGGADQAALADARRVGSPEGAESFVADLLAGKGLLMGMGHREYRTVDPRARLLKPMAEARSRGAESENDYLTLAALEAAFNRQMASKGRSVRANVEFYKGAVFETIGIPDDCFTALFTMARSVGWLAHFIESRLDNRIMRPKALYTGQPLREIPPGHADRQAVAPGASGSS